MKKEIELWEKAPSRPDLPDNRGWWAQWRTPFGDIIDVQGPFKTRKEAEIAKYETDSQS